jgi:hypothetical protein
MKYILQYHNSLSLSLSQSLNLSPQKKKNKQTINEFKNRNKKTNKPGFVLHAGAAAIITVQHQTA